MGLEGPHAGIDKRHTSPSCCPGVVARLIHRAKTTHVGMEILKFDPGLTFQLLNEMTVPMQARVEAAHAAARQTTAGLHHFTHGQASPGEIGRQAGTAFEGHHRARHTAGIALHALAQEIIQFHEATLTASWLPQRAGVLRQLQVLGCRDCSQLDLGKGGQMLGRRRQRFSHAFLPALGPPLTPFQSSGDAELGDLNPGDAMVSRPGQHLPVALIGKTIARFLMAPKSRDTKGATCPFQHRDHITAAHDQRLTQLSQRMA